MPYKSKAQERAFHAKLAAGEIDKTTVDEWDRASRGKKLPERASRSTKPKTPMTPRARKGRPNSKYGDV